MAETVQPKKSNSLVRAICIIVGLVLMFLGGKIFPTWGPMTELGVAMLCAFIGLIILITGTNDTIWPSCAALLAIIMWGYQNSATAIANFVGTKAIIALPLYIIVATILFCLLGAIL